MKIIILNDNFFTNVDIDKYGLKLFNEKKIKVENWTLLYLIPKKYKKKKLKDVYLGNDIENFDNKFFKSYNDVINQINLNLLNKTIYICNCNFNSKNYSKISDILYFLKKINKTIIGFEVSLVPSRVKKLNYLRLIFENRNKIFLKLIKKIQNIKFDYKNYRPKKIYHDYYFICGKKSIDRNFLKLFDAKKNKIINSCSYDYSRYLKFDKKNIKSLGYNYSLFIDEFNLFHPDIYFHTSHEPIVNKNYYIEVRRFLDYYERITNNRVVIAKHPKNNIENLYNRLEILNILKYVNNAKHILAHSSGAINIAILNKKNILFLNSKNYSNSYQKSINLFATTINQKEIYIHDMKEYNSYNFDSHISQKNYKKYIEDFINASGKKLTHIEHIYNTIV